MAKKKAAGRKKLDPSLPIFQLKIAIDHIEPSIWRRIETHDCSLADLHDIIQSCMGWDDEHLHAFEIGDEQYTDLSRGGDSYEFRNSKSVRLSKLVERGQYRFDYEYDFGDSWRHAIEIENTLPPEENVRYPRCLDGKRACPPEDCGGPYGYAAFLHALANPDAEESAERLEWLGEDFDPEAFSVDGVNRGLLRLRRWIGRHRMRPGQTARFAVGDRIRAKRGVVHSQYPDIPLGGWVATVTRVAWLIPVSYEIRWTEETLAAAHPVYAKRCQRDDAKPESHWLDEGEMEAASAEQPVEMEQPARLVARPLSADDQDDRIRAVFGLTGDDPLPTLDDETEQQYLSYLTAHLTFPFEAMCFPEWTPDSETTKNVVVVGFASPSPIDVGGGILCEARCGEQVEQVALAALDLDEDDANRQYVDDYQYWRQEVQDLADYDEKEEGGYWDIGGDKDDEEDEEEDEDDEDDEEDYEDEEEDEDFRTPLAEKLGVGLSPSQPICRERPPIGRNDPCPCGSGKKFKKCCLKKQGDAS